MCTLCDQVWRETMVVLTHAHAARDARGPTEYETFCRQRRNIVAQILRQAAGDVQVSGWVGLPRFGDRPLPGPRPAQVRNPIFVVDCHPACPKNSYGQPYVFENNQVRREVASHVNNLVLTLPCPVPCSKSRGSSSS